MKNYILGIFLVSRLAFGSDPLVVSVLNVHDGDTIKTNFTLPAPLNEVSIRINGIDTPEMPANSYQETGKLGRSKCVKEADLALQARDYLKLLIKEHGGMISLKEYDWDKYGGRINAKVFVIDLETQTELEISPLMIQKGFAYEYFGFGSKKNWCD